MYILLVLNLHYRKFHGLASGLDKGLKGVRPDAASGTLWQTEHNSVPLTLSFCSKNDINLERADFKKLWVWIGTS